MSMRPCSSEAARTQAVAWSLSPRSTGAVAVIEPPAARTIASVSRLPAWSRSQPTTTAPPAAAPRAAPPRPWPPAVPEIRATRPLNRPVTLLSSFLAERAKGTLVEKQRRPSAGVCAEVVVEVKDVRHDQPVVARLVHGPDAAVDPGQSPFDARAQCPRARGPGHARELVGAADREPAADRLLIGGQDAGAELALLGHHRPGRRGQGDAQRHQRRVERQRGEGLNRQSDRPSLVPRGDDHDPGREVAKRRPEIRGPVHPASHYAILRVDSCADFSGSVNDFCICKSNFDLTKMLRGRPDREL